MYKKGQKVKVLVGCVWQNAEIEDEHMDTNYYLCGTNKWSTHFHVNDIKPINDTYLINEKNKRDKFLKDLTDED